MGWELPGVTSPCVPPVTAGSDVGVAPGGSSSMGSCFTGRGSNPGGGWTCNQNTMVKNVCMYIIRISPSVSKWHRVLMNKLFYEVQLKNVPDHH